MQGLSIKDNIDYEEEKPQRQYITTKKHTLCWDCARATGGCAWSSRFEPVKGWVATEIHGRPTKEAPNVIPITYTVKECPDFVRDAENFGLTRMAKPLDNIDPKKMMKNKLEY